MNFLYPLFLAGITVISLPIILHMIHRHTRKRLKFSSLMFLSTSIPRFRNRSRLENLPLLILRCIILCLLALGFSRPFFPQAEVNNSALPGKRTVLLIDTSASMRRAGIREQVINEAQAVLKNLGQTDRVCVMSFDQSTTTLIGFEQWEASNPSQRASIVIEQISKLSPGWAQTNLGQALISAAEAIEDDEVNDEQQPVSMSQIVLISDLQKGSNIEAMYAYEWAKEMELVVKLVRCQSTTNAALQLVTDRSILGGPDKDSRPGIRITNSSDATNERFQLNWTDEITDVYVPPGRSTVVRAPAQTDQSKAQQVILTGDDHAFDNTLHLAPYLRQQVKILYVGSDNPDDSGEMLYYLRKAYAATGALEPRIIPRPGNKTIEAADIETAQLIIVTDSINQENIASLRRYLESGRTLFLVMKSPDSAADLAGLIDIKNIECEEADIDRYAMLSRMEFKHPLLMPFSEPRFGDFTKIHFWKYRRINIDDLPDARVLACFDSGDPAFVEYPVGKGSLLLLTCGWHPSDSQLALSSKFVPLLYSILEYDGSLTANQLQYFVGDHIPIPQSLKPALSNLKIRKPNNSLINLEKEQQFFTQTDLPGIYTIESSAGNRLFAVNLPAKECQTAAMPVEDLERLGVSLKQSSSVAAKQIHHQRLHSSFEAMENEQKVWRWVFIALLAVLLIETWLAGWLTRRPSNQQEGQK